MAVALHPGEAEGLARSLQLFHQHRQLLRDACDSLKKPLATANAFLNSALADDSEASQSNDPQESTTFFKSTSETDEAIDKLFKIGVTLSDTEKDYTNPSIVVVGQTKAGKSSLINALLCGEYLCSMSTACTGRLTRLTYGDSLRVRRRFPNKPPEPWTEVEGTRIPRELVQLSPEERHDPDQVNVIVEAEVPSEFLKTGIDIYDSPGRNENSKLRKLTDQTFNSLVPMIVYVIDGRKKLSPEDKADLDQIKRNHPTSNIFYVITKLDQPTTGRRRGQPRDLTEDTMVNNTLDEVYRNLVDRGCLPEGAGSIPTKISHFHGVSLLRVSEWRKKGIKTKDQMPNLVHSFEKLQEELFKFIESRLDGRVSAAALSLQQLAAGVLESCVRRANTNAIANFRHLRHLKVKQALEGAIYSHLIHILTASKETRAIAEKIDTFLSTCRKRVIAKIPGYTYSDAILIPPRDKDGLNMSQRCKEDLLQFILLTITTELRAFLEDTVLSEQLELLRQSAADWDPEVSVAFKNLDLGLEDSANAPVTKEEVMRSMSTEMKDSILNAYRLALDEAAERIWIGSALDSVRTFFRDLWRRITAIFRSRSPEISSDEPQPTIIMSIDGEEKEVTQVVVPNEYKSAHWKSKEADLILDQIIKLEIGGKVCQVLKDYIGVIHREQQDRFAREEALNIAYRQIAREDRKKISDLTPPFASAYLVAVGIRNRYQIRNVTILGPLGVGSQGTVHKCRIRQFRCDSDSEVLVAMKQVLIQEKLLPQQALEVFYSTAFDHPHLLPVSGVHYDFMKREEVHRIRIFMPLKACNCRSFLVKSAEHGKAPMRVRLNIANQVGQALVYLHEQGIVHRDIKLENILLDTEYNAFVADYGLTKPVGLTNWSVVGSPIHMAPEIITNAVVSLQSRQTVTYNEAVDTYAFGVLMWYLVEGTGRHPEFVQEMRDVYEVLNATRMGTRPERPKDISDSLWELIQECWKEKAEERPTMETTTRRLQECIAITEAD